MVCTTYDPPVLERVIGRRQNGIDMSPVFDVVQIDVSAFPVHPAAPIAGCILRFGNGTNVVGFFFFRLAAAPLN